MEPASVNYLAVLIAGAAYMIFGALWYSPILFADPWMKWIGKTKEQVAKDFSPLNYLWAFILSLIAAYGIARLMVWSGRDTVAAGIVIGLLAGVCFVLTSMGINDLFEARPKGLTVTNILYHVAGFVIIGIIIGVM